MIDLLTQYSLSDILMFVIILAIGIRGFLTFWDWAVARLTKIFNKENQKEKEKEEIDNQFVELEQRVDVLTNNQDNMQQSMRNILDKIDLLISSDKDDIKAFITEKHHYFCYEKQWIDDYSLDCLEKRFGHYKDEGGNSFIKDLMDEIRALPRRDPNSID